MPRPDGRLEPGQPLRGAISARAWNRAQDAADLVLGANPSTEGVPGSLVLKPYTWAYCRPSVTVARWGVLAITGVAITPTSSAGGATASFEEMPVLTGGTPSATTTAWCVAVEPIAANAIGRVAVGGVVQCKVEVDKADDKFVACSSGGLKTSTSGEGLILYKEAGTGAGKWALVRLLAGPQGITRGTFSAPWAKNATATVTDAITTSTTYTGVKNYLNSIGGTGQRDCVIAYLGNEWVLVAVAPQGVVRGTFTAPWNKGSTKTVADAVASGTTYADVKNYFANVAGAGTKACAIAYVGTEWILIAAECS